MKKWKLPNKIYFLEWNTNLPIRDSGDQHLVLYDASNFTPHCFKRNIVYGYKLIALAEVSILGE